MIMIYYVDFEYVYNSKCQVDSFPPTPHIMCFSEALVPKLCTATACHWFQEQKKGAPIILCVSFCAPACLACDLDVSMALVPKLVGSFPMRTAVLNTKV